MRVELGEVYPSVNSLYNVYTRAAQTLTEWRLQGILQQDRQPAYYVYQQRFTHHGQSHTRTSLFARVRLEPWSTRVVLPHENTLSRAKEDRLRLYRACSINCSPIMSLYEDPQGRLRQLLSTYTGQPEIQIVDEVGEEHRLYTIHDLAQMTLIEDFFSQRQLYIADGHHRYETALAYRAEAQEQQVGLQLEDATNFALMALIDLDDPGMLVLPTHRILFGLPQDLLARLAPEPFSQYFAVEELPGTTSDETLLQQLQQAGQQQAALLLKTAEQTLLLRLNEQGRHFMGGSGHSPAWNELDVAIAERLILEKQLGLNSSGTPVGAHVRCTHESAQAFQALATGGAQAIILLNATRQRQICAVAQADDRMPPKSTYLYPKLVT